MAQSKYWMFTINNYAPEDDPLQWVGRNGVSYVVYQKEKGSEGTPHLQGYCEVDKKKSLGGMKKLHSRAHWDLRNGTQEQAIAYCTKRDETYVAGPWEAGTRFQSKQGQRTDLEAACAVALEKGIPAAVKEFPAEFSRYYKGIEYVVDTQLQEQIREEEAAEFDGAVLRPWQEDLLAKLQSPPDDRKINWYWESTGNVGKTWMARYLMTKHKATVLDCSKKADLMYMLKDHRGKVVVFNIVRSIDEQFMQHVYTCCEQIKDGLVINTKYQSRRIPLGKQHVVVFANIPPDETKWSSDRCIKKEIKEPVADALSLLSDNAPPVPKLKRAAQKEPESPGCSVCGTGFCICSQAGRGPQYKHQRS